MGLRFLGGGGGGGPGGDHSLLFNLDYSVAGHTGFADAAHGVTDGDAHDHGPGSGGAQISHADLSNLDFALAGHTGVLDGDNLPAMSALKKGGVPATGVPSGLFLRDDGTFALAGGSSEEGLGYAWFL